MGDSLEENFVLGGSDVDAPVKPTAKILKKRNLRELLSDNKAGSAGAQRQTVQEALTEIENLEDFQFFDKDVSAASLSEASDQLREIFRDKHARILVLTSSANRVTALAESDEFAACTPLPLQFHGTGRKQEQLAKMRKDIANPTFKTVIGVSARIARFVEDGALDLSHFALVAIDVAPDAKKFNTLSQRESRLALVELFNAGPSFNVVLF